MGRKINFTALILIVALVFFGIYSLDSHGLISDPGKLADFIRGFGQWAYLIFFLIVLMEVVVAPIPGSLVYPIGGILFGTFVGGTLALVANMVGAAIAFYIGKNIILDEEKKQKTNYLDRMIIKYGAYSIFILRINPLTSSDIFSFLAGFLKMDFKKFILATTLALLPLVYIQAYIGDEILIHNELLSSILVIASLIFILVILIITLGKGLSKWNLKKH